MLRPSPKLQRDATEPYPATRRLLGAKMQRMKFEEAAKNLGRAAKAGLTVEQFVSGTKPYLDSLPTAAELFGARSSSRSS